MALGQWGRPFRKFTALKINHREILRIRNQPFTFPTMLSTRPAFILSCISLVCLPYFLQGGTKLTAWGTNGLGQTNVPPNLTNIIAVAAGSAHSVALNADGSVVVWGQTRITPVGLTRVAAIAAGEAHTLALRSDGTVVAWGRNK